MNETDLSRSLHRVLAVDQDEVDGLRRAVAAAVPTRSDPRPPRRLVAVAAILIALTVAMLVLVPRAGHLLTIEPSDDPALTSFDEPPGLAALMAASDAVVLGRVAEVDGTRARFAIDRVLRGDAALPPAAATGRDVHVLASRDAVWRPGTTGLLFVVRSAKSGNLEVRFGEHGFVEPTPRGFWGVFSLDDVAAVIAGGLPAARVVELLRDRGPKVLSEIRWHCQQLPDWRLPTDAPGFQAAIAQWWERTERPAADLDALLPAANGLTADGVRSLSAPALARYEDGWTTAAREREARFVADWYLAGAATARLPWARDRVLETIAAIENENTARGRLSLAVAEHVELLELLARFGPDDAASAVRRARALRPLVPERDREANDRLLLFRLDHGDAEAAADTVADFERRLAAGEHTVPLGPLLACPVAAALPALLRALHGERFGELFTRYDPVLREVLRRRPHPPLLSAAAAELQERVADERQPFAAFEVFLDLHLAAGGSARRAAALPHFLTDAFDPGIAGRELVAAVERDLGVRVLAFADPTDDEVRAAARRLAARLR